MLNLQEPVMMNTVWMLSDTGPHNGGTRIVSSRPSPSRRSAPRADALPPQVPGSHRSMLASVPAGYTPQFVHTPTAKAGSVLVYNGQVRFLTEILDDFRRFCR